MKQGLRTKTILALSALVFTSGLYAANCGSGKCGMAKCGAGNPQGKYCEEKRFDHYMKYRSHHKGDSSRFIIGAVYALELSDKQKVSIDSALEEYQKNRMKRFNAFSAEGFDKEAYIKSRMQTKEDMLKAKAELFEKIYSVLTKEQKSELKKEIDDFESARSQRMGKGYGDKSCYGRR